MHTRFGRLASAATTVLIGAMLLGPAAASAANEPNAAASCIGLEMAAISPPGTSDEEPGGASQFVGEIKELAATFGARPGTLFAFVASIHAGSHADCDEALEE